MRARYSLPLGGGLGLDDPNLLFYPYLIIFLVSCRVNQAVTKKLLHRSTDFEP